MPVFLPLAPCSALVRPVKPEPLTLRCTLSSPTSFFLLGFVFRRLGHNLSLPDYPNLHSGLMGNLVGLAHGQGQKKSPDRIKSIRGCPFFSSRSSGLPPIREGHAFCSGRSSDSRINLLAAPSHPFCNRQWLMRRSSPITAAGPPPSLTGFPIKLFRAPEQYDIFQIKQG